MDEIQKREQELRLLKQKKLDEERKGKLEAEKKFKQENGGLDIYTNDDYCGCWIWNYSFYYGYEVTKCPVKSHKTDDDCYEKDCDKREWYFQAYKWDDIIAEYSESELWSNRYIVETLIAWILKCIYEGKL